MGRISDLALKKRSFGRKLFFEKVEARILLAADAAGDQHASYDTAVFDDVKLASAHGGVNEAPRIVSGTVVFDKQVLDNTVDETHFVVAADLTGNGRLDIVATDYLDDSVFWYEQDAAGAFTKHVLDSSLNGAYPLGLGDVDGNGAIDVLAAGYDGDAIVWYQNDGTGNFTRQDVDLAADGAHSVVASDLDQDGDVDLIATLQDADLLLWYENDGAENFTRITIDIGLDGAKRAEVADLNNDGELDIATASFFDDQIAWYENDGSESFIKHVVDAASNGAYFVTLTDVDDDGDVDILSASQLADSVAIYRNDGAGTFTAQIIDAAANGARTVQYGDIDRDGLIDVLSATVDDDSIAWYRNDGVGGFNKFPIDIAAAGAYGLFVADIDHDGNPDVVSADRDDDSVTVHYQKRHHQATVTAGQSLVLDASHLETTDLDDGPAELTYTLVTTPASSLELDGVPLAVNDTFTQADVNAGRLAYVHDGVSVGIDQFDFTVADGGEGGLTPAAGTFVLSIQAVATFITHLPLDEGVGTTAVDASGQGNDGTLTSGPVYVATTGDGSPFAVRLDGVDDYIDLGTLDVQGGGGFSTALWLNADAYGGSAQDPRLVSKADGVGANDHVFMLSTIRSNSEVRLRGRLRVAGVTTTLVASSGALSTGVWHHAAMTYDGVTMRLYLDGQEVGSTLLSGVIDVDPTMGVAVGAQPPGAGPRYFDGLLDDVRIYDEALTPEQISELVAGGAPAAVDDGYATDEDGPLVVAAASGVLSNDQDNNPPADLTATLLVGPSDGVLNLGADGSFDYTPDLDFNGLDSFTYEAVDGGNGTTSSATVSITVNPINDAPVAVDDAYQTDLDTQLTIAAAGVLGNDSDIDGDPLAATLVTNVSDGTLTLNPDGSFDYTPDPGFSGQDTFTYMADDGTLNSLAATVTINVLPAPTAVDDGYATDEDVQLVVDAASGVLANDQDNNPPADLTAVLIAGPTDGVLNLNADGSFDYTPDADFNGLDSFTYDAVDGGNGAVATATVTLTINPTNDAPTAGDDGYTTPLETDLIVDAASGVLANDTDIDNDPLQANLVADVSNGTLTLNPDGSFTYTPDLGFSGEDVFTYVANDGLVDSNVATVTITVTAGSFITHLPLDEGVGTTAIDASGQGNDGTLTSGPVYVATTGDGSPFAVRLDGVDDYIDLGTLDVQGGGGFSTALWLNADAYGGSAQDPRLVSKADGVGANDHVFMLSTIRSNSEVRLRGRLRVAGVTTTLVASSGALSTGVWHHAAMTYDGVTMRLYLDGQEVGSTLLSGVIDVDPTMGVAVGAQPPGAGPRYFDGLLDDVRIYDEALTPEQISELVAGGAPAAVDDGYATDEDGPLVVAAASGVLSNDQDNNPPADLTATLLVGPSDGVLNLGADGSFDYTPDLNFNGLDSFTYEAVDGGNGTTSSATVSITVNPINDAPVAVDDAYQTDLDTQLTIAAAGVLGNDSDIDGDPLAATLVTNVSDGTLTLNPDGSFDYTPDPGFSGQDTFTYMADDGTLNSLAATVTINVLPAPTAVDDGYATDEDVQLVVDAASGVLANDQDNNPPADLTAVLIVGPTDGVLNLNADGSFDYTPDADFNGLDSFTYDAVDGGNGAVATATVTLTINPTNDAPTAGDDGYTTPLETDLIVDAASGVLANDTDIDNDPLQANLVADVSNGTLTLNPDGSFTYTPDLGFSGEDAFTYVANDGLVDSNVATVTITVTAGSFITHLPLDEGVGTTAVDASGQGNDGTLTSGPVYVATTGDGSPFAVRLDGVDDYIDLGTLDVQGGGGFSTALWLNADAYGGSAQDPRLVSKADGVGANDHVFMLSTIRSNSEVRLRGRLRVAGVTTTLVASSGALSTGVWHHAAMTYDGVTMRLYLDGQEVGSTLLSGVIDVDPTMGVAVGAQPPGAGPRYFDGLLDDVRIYDEALTPEQISELVAGGAPAAVDDGYATDEDGPLVVAAASGVLSNDQDNNPPADLTATLLVGPSDGVLNLGADGSFDYTPDLDFNGLDSFTYEAVDGGNGTTSSATVSITVNPINDAPVAVDDAYQTDLDTQLTIAAAGVLGNDSDVDGDPLAATLVTDVSDGTLTLNPDGSFDYTPDPGFSGQDTFTYVAEESTSGYEVDATVDASGVLRTDKVVDLPIDFTQLFTDLGVGGSTLDLASLSVAEVDSLGVVIDPSVPFQFDPSSGFDATTNAIGNIAFLAAGDTQVGVSRMFRVYFDVAGAGTYQPPVFADQVIVTDDVLDAGQSSFLVETGSADYYYQKQGAGFSSIVDIESNDWINHNQSAGSFGLFRGIPNLVYPEGDFHPGATTGITTLLSDGPLKATIHSVTTNGLWEATWEIYPEYAELTVLQADGNYWFLYEGTPGGLLEPNSDTVVRPDGTETLTSQSWSGDLVGDEWVYFTDPNLDRSLFIANHQDDTAIDSYRQQDNAMTVFGFGRDVLNPLLDHVPGRYTVGLVESTSFAPTSSTITAAYKDLSVVLGAATLQSPTGNELNSNVATVTIDVSGGPTALDDGYATDEDVQLVVNAVGGVLANDQDNNPPDDLTAILITGPTDGVLNLSADGSFDYTPDLNFNGQDSFTYDAVDGGNGTTGTATVTITVNSINDAPVAANDAYQATFETELIVDAAGGVLTSDSDIDGDPLTAGLVADVSDGTLTLNADGSFSYTPDPGFSGQDAFTYVANDGLLDSNIATVTIDVTPGPTAVDDGYATDEDVQLVVNAVGGVLANDQDNNPPDDLTAILITGPTDGVLNLSADGSFDYTPGPDFNGQDSFTYDAVDGGNGTTGTATVTITVNSINDAPVAADDGYQATFETELIVDAAGGVLTSDSDIDGDPLTAGLVADVSDGTLTLNADGSFTYTPDPGFSGQDTFTYVANDGLVDSNVATVTISVAGGIVSDDFSAPTLNTNLWSILDPRNDATVTMTGTQLSIAVPAGVSHDLWTGNNNAVRVLQNVPDEDFRIETKLDASVLQRHQIHGLAVQQDINNLVRVDVEHDGTTMRATAVTMTAGVASLKTYAAVAINQPPTYLRLTRTGDDWLFEYSEDGQAWTTASQFTFALTVNEVGVLAGNHGNTPAQVPAFTALFDYFIAVNSPPVANDDAAATPEDTPVVIDVLANDTDSDGTIDPTTVVIVSGPSRGTVSVDPVTGEVTYTPELGYVTADALTYTVNDNAGGTSNPATVTLTVGIGPEIAGPAIDLWYGQQPSFGQLGRPQEWVNVLGNVVDPDGIASLSYTLNGGSSQTLEWGPDSRRLHSTGDFNVEIDADDLLDGANVVQIRAEDDLGNVRFRTVDLLYTSGTTWPFPSVVDWESVAEINDAAQVIDGLWSHSDEGVRSIAPGYDRLIALGDRTLQDYQVETEFTVHSLLGFPGFQPAIGIIMRWPGHNENPPHQPGDQPRIGFDELGAITWFRWLPDALGPRLQIIDGDEQILIEDVGGFTVQLGVKYNLRASVETLATGYRYRFTVWESTLPESSGVELEVEVPLTETMQGSPVLLAHRVNATFGDVSVSSVGAASASGSFAPVLVERGLEANDAATEPRRTSTDGRDRYRTPRTSSLDSVALTTFERRSLDEAGMTRQVAEKRRATMHEALFGGDRILDGIHPRWRTFDGF